jgi:hypothetical protein
MVLVLPNMTHGEHRDHDVALEQRDACVADPIGAPELESARRLGGATKPDEQRVDQRREPTPARIETVEQRIGDDVSQDAVELGHTASTNAEITVPATAAAMPFRKESLRTTRPR